MKNKIGFLLVLLLVASMAFAQDIWEASFTGKLDVVKRFIEIIETDPNTLSDEGFTPMQYAIVGKQYEIIRYLMDLSEENIQSEENMYRSNLGFKADTFFNLFLIVTTGDYNFYLN